MVSRVNSFNWDKLIKNMDVTDSQRSVQVLRGEASGIGSTIIYYY